jgi:hypothetical protein
VVADLTFYEKIAIQPSITPISATKATPNAGLRHQGVTVGGAGGMPLGNRNTVVGL